MKNLISFILLLGLSPLFSQTHISGVLSHSNSYFTLNPYNASYDDGSKARLFYDGNKKSINFWNSMSDIVYSNINAGSITANGNLIVNSSFISNGSITTMGNLGIGLTNPTEKLQIRKGGQNIRLMTGENSSGYTFDIGVNDDGINFTNNSRYRGYNFSNGNGNLLSISSHGKVAIATSNTGSHKLAVGGSIGANEIKVEVGSWSDFVFYDDYDLPTLEEVETHIKQKGHLQDIPSAAEVQEDGVNLGEMNAKLLQKIEELMLYTIQQQKEIDKLKTGIDK